MSVYYVDMTGAVLAETPFYCTHKFTTAPQMQKLVTLSEGCSHVCLLPCCMLNQAPMAVMLSTDAGRLHRLNVTFSGEVSAENKSAAYQSSSSPAEDYRGRRGCAGVIPGAV